MQHREISVELYRLDLGEPHTDPQLHCLLLQEGTQGVASDPIGKPG
jgi:hypothetical protein